MKPTLKVHSIAFAVATAIVFWIWTAFFELAQLSAASKALLGGLIWLGTFRLIANVLITATKRISWVKRLVLGPDFLEGTWVGFYIGVSGNVRYIIEIF